MRLITVLGLISYLPFASAQIVFAKNTVSTGKITIDGRVIHNGSYIEGSGNKVTRIHKMEPLNRVTVSGSFDFRYTPGQPQVSVTGDDNIISSLVLKLNDGHLNISLPLSYSTQQDIVVHVSSPVLNDLEIEGSGDARVEDIVSSDFKIKLSGASEIFISGTVDHFALNITGASEMNGRDLVARYADVEMTGSGDCSITVTEKLKVLINGAGDMTYYGHPETVLRQVNGVGEIVAGD
jgi:hypothetical protein